MRKKLLWAAVVVCAIAVIRFVPTTFFYTPDVGEKTVSIQRGMGILDIASHLKNEGIIKDRGAFIAYVVLTGNRSKLQAGEYTFKGEYAVYQIADLVSNGLSLSSEATVVIPEGFTIAEIGERLAETGVEQVGDLAEQTIDKWTGTFPFLAEIAGRAQSLEGFLFPDTYKLEKKADAGVIVARMLRNFEAKTGALREKAGKENKDFYEVMILASILEKEVPVQDMPRAAGVLAKRLAAGLPLQTDATLVYVLGRPIRTEDTRTLASPYNTYRVKGLPPTPIGNPGLAALEAALNPEENEYWYYLSRRDTGETIFSRTFQEHQRAREQYLQ
jgi:UPF0755 protein